VGLESDQPGSGVSVQRAPWCSGYSHGHQSHHVAAGTPVLVVPPSASRTGVVVEWSLTSPSQQVSVSPRTALDRECETDVCGRFRGMRKFRLVPQNREFYRLFDRAASNLVTTSEMLLDLLQHYPDRSELVAQIKDREHVGDEVTHEIVQLLNRTFVTPIDREDIYDLASALDDICDFMDEVADELHLYGVEEVPQEAIEQAGVIHGAVCKLSEAVANLEGLKDVQVHLVAVHELENEGDRIVRDAVAKLFSNGLDPLIVIRWKDIHEDLEQAIDGCERAAHVLESVYLKNR
jgi:predicted phosphate transport protein (TIGR00153 family)